MRDSFYETIADDLLQFAGIIAKHNGKWVFCKHRQRNTCEIAGGHREPNEEIAATAVRELKEETGAVVFSLRVSGTIRTTVFAVIGYAIAVSSSVTIPPGMPPSSSLLLHTL